MPSFDGLRRRIPPPLHSTKTVYTHLTRLHIEVTDRKTDNPPEETKPKPYLQSSARAETRANQSHQRPSTHSHIESLTESQSTTTNETLCAITTRERSGGSSKKQRKPARNQIPNTTRRFVHHRTNQKKNEADLVLEGAAPLPRSEKQVYVTGKLPRTPKPDQEQQRRRKSRPQASPYTESLDLRSGAPDLRRGKRLPPPRTTKKTGER
ncbi:hypothetical protein F2Q70_00009116 [Brassica cretica]|uniref:Uncharacterized protein n=1 Tax=Brassica cretica TaxID=69181 RepID=A0A8S9M1A4_BRACR|nr:hypothetical protein F2Q70_00009116 [Brassica cretica]